MAWVEMARDCRARGSEVQVIVVTTGKYDISTSDVAQNN